MEIDITKVLSQNEFAEKIGTSRQYVNRKIKLGKIKPLLLAGKEMIYLPFLDEKFKNKLK